MIRYGIVGTGYFGADLARSIRKIDDAEVTAVFDSNHAEEVAMELQADVCNSLDELVCRNDVDCVIVASPSHLHREPVIKAAEHGKHVFCEKPIALNFEDCKAMVDACHTHQVKFMAGHIMNFFNGVHQAKRLISEGRIGKVLYCHATRTGWEEPQSTVSWKKIRAQSGGHLYHHIHELDCIQFMMGGLPERVTMVGGNVYHKGDQFGDEDDMLILTLEYDDDRYALLEYGNAFRWGEHYVLIEGTKGAIKLDLYQTGGTLRVKGEDDSHFLIHETQEEDNERTAIYTGRGMDGAIAYGKPGIRTPLWLQTCIDKEMSYLHHVLTGGTISEEYLKLLNGVAALESIATADACTISLNEDRKVSLDEVTQGLL
ncbi:Gfo/Idh/MocA family protein [Staphylococcus lutrae]|uniref:Oxidoreductase n=1 Tax=Staphylococcus lutrae TaxID=155085 RepID=A0AAC9RV35_9STAP|nr:Gfo/Idh/MocA family oxidoreductase [Staphylococcus lutrae]ARJ51620.1 oxidoreductase [Staphylococcus lutrae]PNZ36736.1 gfo/Idh/MocA family oxidoreductase [Staphylococcus lutrae]